MDNRGYEIKGRQQEKNIEEKKRQDKRTVVKRTVKRISKVMDLMSNSNDHDKDIWTCNMTR